MTEYAQTTLFQSLPVKPVREERRPGSNGHSTWYSMTTCPLCHVSTGQRRGARNRTEEGWIEELTCGACGRTWTRALLPIEIERAGAV